MRDEKGQTLQTEGEMESLERRESERAITKDHQGEFHHGVHADSVKYFQSVWQQKPDGCTLEVSSGRHW